MLACSSSSSFAVRQTVHLSLSFLANDGDNGDDVLDGDDHDDARADDDDDDDDDISLS